MKVSKESWHYRMIGWMSSSQKTNLCPYVRQVIGHMLLVLLLCVLAIAVTSLMTYPIWRWWMTEAVTGFFSFLAWCAVGTLAIKIYREEWCRPREYNWFNMDKWYHRELIPQFILLKAQAIAFDRRARPPKPPNVFWEFLKAAHDKVCPGIEFK